MEPGVSFVLLLGFRDRVALGVTDNRLFVPQVPAFCTDVCNVGVDYLTVEVAVVSYPAPVPHAVSGVDCNQLSQLLLA
jgi:hypothetical protein